MPDTSSSDILEPSAIWNMRLKEPLVRNNLTIIIHALVTAGLLQCITPGVAFEDCFGMTKARLNQSPSGFRQDDWLDEEIGEWAVNEGGHCDFTTCFETSLHYILI